MSVRPSNADLARVDAEAQATPGSNSSYSSPSNHAGHEALEALLAFCSLHQQAYERRTREPVPESERDPERWELEQFVLEEVLQLVAERALTIAGADGVAIALADEDAIVCRASAGNVAPDRGMRVDLNSGFSGACLLSRQVVRCDDSETDSRVSPEACRGLGARSMVAIPLTTRDSVIGLIEAFSSVPHGFNDSDVSSLSLLAELILAALRPEDERLLVEASQRLVGQEQSVAAVPPAIPQEAESPLEMPTEGAEPASDVASAGTGPGEKSSRLVLVIAAVILGVVALLILGLMLGGALPWKIGRRSQPAAPIKQSAATPLPPQTSTPAPAQPSTPPPDEVPAETQPSSETPRGLSTITGIRHWSAANSSTIVIDMDDQVPYEAHRLANPTRIYFDLHETQLGSDFPRKIINIDDSLIQRVRVAQPAPGLTRVVIETKSASSFSANLEPNPYRLVVEVRKIEAATGGRSKLEFIPMKPAATVALESAGLVPRLRIVLDPGHGGPDLGTVGRQGLLEKDLVLDIAARLGALLGRLGADVLYTRQEDSYVPLEKRTEIANLADADLFLSIHANYSDFPSARGVETYYTNTYSSIKARSPESEESDLRLQNVNWTGVDIREKVRYSYELATNLQYALVSMLAPTNPGLRNRGVKEAQYVVLTGTMMPAVLAEISFVSSPADANNLLNPGYRQQIAQALYLGIKRFAERFPRVKQARAENQSDVVLKH
jgi:N-acetylmuramoyl-L-alanine amidase/putative methionine-R-sulfoxide reductase with GAF domain